MTKTQEQNLINELQKLVDEVKMAHDHPHFNVNKEGVEMELNRIIAMLNA